MATQVLFIGNSFTHRGYTKSYVDEILKDLAGKKIGISLSIHEGKSIRTFWSIKSIRDSILDKASKKKYNYIILQGNHGSKNSAWFKNGVQLIAALKKACPTAQIILYVPHPNAYGTYSTIKSRYDALAKATNVKCWYVGKYWADIESKYKIKMISKDNRHAGWKGYYLAAVVFYCHLFKERPSAEIVSRANEFTESQRQYLINLVADDLKLPKSLKSSKPKDPADTINTVTSTVVPKDKTLKFKTSGSIKALYNVNARTAASTASKNIYKTIKKNTTIKYSAVKKGTNYYWAKISINNKTLWVVLQDVRGNKMYWKQV